MPLHVSQPHQQHLLQSRADEIAATEQLARQNVAVEVQHLLEMGIKQSVDEGRRMLEEQAQEHAQQVDELTISAAKREEALEGSLQSARSRLAEERTETARLVEAARAQAQEHAAALEDARRATEEAVREEQALSVEDRALLATQAQQLRILEAELRQAERAERLGVMQASAAMSEANNAAVELITLRKDKQELLQEEEDLTNRLHELTAEHREAQKSFEIAQSAAQVLMRRRQERLVKKLQQEHVSEVEALRLEKEQALRAEHEAAAAVLNKTVHQWEGTLVERALRPV